MSTEITWRNWPWAVVLVYGDNEPVIVDMCKTAGDAEISARNILVNLIIKICNTTDNHVPEDLNNPDYWDTGMMEFFLLRLTNQFYSLAIIAVDTNFKGIY